MELRHLRYFVAVGAEEHLGRAAKTLHITQPALTRQIQSLERELGVLLLERLLRGVRLTPAGRSFMIDAQRILNEVDRATRRAQRVGRGQVGIVRVGFNEVASWSGIVPQSFQRFRLNEPDVELELTPMMSMEQLKALEDGKIDAGYMYLRPKQGDQFCHIAVQTETFVVALPANHPLAQCPELRLADLRNEHFVWLRRAVGPVFYDGLMAACRAGGLSPNIIQEANSEGTVLSLVSVGLGIGIVTTGIGYRRPEGITLRPLSDLEFSLQLELVWNRNNDSRVLHRFIDTVEQLLSQQELGHSEDSLS